MSSQLYCPVCAAAITAGAQFCSNCGSQFSREQPSPIQIAGETPPPVGVIGIDYAGFWIRMLAFIVDEIPVVMMIALVYIVTENQVTRILLGISILFTYFVGFWVATNGSTPGKFAMGVRIVRSNGEPIDVSWAMIRFIGYCLSFVLLLSGFVMIAFTPQKRGLHDYIAQTVVVRVR